MKKIIIIRLVIMYSVLFFVHAAEGHAANRISATGGDTPKAKTTVVNANNANTKAVSDFKKRFNKTDDVQWVSDKDGFVSYFKVDGFTNKVCYDKKGNWEYSMILYNESKLPKDIRTLVKSAYYDMSITLVKEIQTPKGKGYVVNLEDKATIRIVKVNEQSEMETIQEIFK